MITKNRLSLKKNFTWNFAGNIFFAFGQWAILALMTKLIAVEEVGNYSYAVAFTAPAILFFQFQVRSLQITDTEDKYSFNEYFGVRIITTVVGVLFIILFSLLIGQESKMVVLLTMVAIFKSLDSISDIFYGLFQKNEFMKPIAISLISKSVGTIIVFYISLTLSKNIILSIFLVILLKTMTILFIDIKYAKVYSDIQPYFNLQILKKITTTTLPLGIMSLLMSLDANIPKYVLKHYLGSESLGYFSALAYINLAGGQMITSIAQAATPRLAQLFNLGHKKRFITLLLKLTIIGTTIGLASVIIVVFLGEGFVTLIYSKEYAQYIDLFIVIMISGAINYSASFLGNGMTAARAFNIQPVLGVIWSVSSFLLSMWLIPLFGLIGGAYALVVSSIIKLLSKIAVIIIIMKNKSGRL